MRQMQDETLEGYSGKWGCRNDLCKQERGFVKRGCWERVLGSTENKFGNGRKWSGTRSSGTKVWRQEWGKERKGKINSDEQDSELWGKELEKKAIGCNFYHRFLQNGLVRNSRNPGGLIWFWGSFDKTSLRQLFSLFFLSIPAVIGIASSAYMFLC